MVFPPASWMHALPQLAGLRFTHTSFWQLTSHNQSLPIVPASYELEHRKGFIWSLKHPERKRGLPSWAPGRLPIAPHILFSLEADGNHELTEGLLQPAMEAASDAWSSWLVAWGPWFCEPHCGSVWGGKASEILLELDLQCCTQLTIPYLSGYYDV